MIQCQWDRTQGVATAKTGGRRCFPGWRVWPWNERPKRQSSWTAPAERERRRRFRADENEADGERLSCVRKRCRAALATAVQDTLAQRQNTSLRARRLGEPRSPAIRFFRRAQRHLASPSFGKGFAALLLASANQRSLAQMQMNALNAHAHKLGFVGQRSSASTDKVLNGAPKDCNMARRQPGPDARGGYLLLGT